MPSLANEIPEFKCNELSHGLLWQALGLILLFFVARILMPPSASGP
jgi:hypothetical protein